MDMIERTEFFVAPLLAAALLAAGPGPSGAQLRPLEAADWAALDGGGWQLEVGSGVYSGQRASLAGTEGKLWEVGTFRAAVSLGRVALQLSGTAFRVFRDEAVFAEPLDGTRPPDGRHRIDTGDYQVSTLVGLLPDDRTFDALIRFGARLPTTDNGVGLERDRTDFFGTVAGRYTRGRLSAAAEAGIGIMGTRDAQMEQVDPILYAGSVAYRWGPVSPRLEVVGQHDTRSGSDLRGTEDLSELRAGLKVLGEPWVQLTLVRGLTAFSPDWGVTLRVGGF